MVKTRTEELEDLKELQLAAAEALQLLREIRAYFSSFPFGDEVEQFIAAHDLIFVAEQNRDGQMRSLLINELQTNPAKLISVLYYAGLSISADTITEQISDYYIENKFSRVTEVQS